MPKAKHPSAGDTRRRFEQWVHNPLCQANTVSAVHGVRMSDVVKFEGGEPTMGQSPFALARGLQFERILFAREATSLIEALTKAGVLPRGASGLADFRLRLNGGRSRTLDDARRATTELLKSAAAQPKRAPAVVVGATVSIPGGVMLPEAVLVMDVLAIRPGDPRPQLLVGEIKTYPDRAGYTDPRELATARAQAGVYVHGLELVLAELGLADAFEVQREGFLVLSRPGSNQPSIRAGEDLRYQAERAKRGFDLLRQAASAIEPLPDPAAESGFKAVVEAAVAFGETCLSFCDRAAICRLKAFETGNPAAIGRDMVRFLGATSLNRAVELLDGGSAVGDAEKDLVRRMQDAKRRAGLA
jgi:hypothetical protein